MTTLYGCASKGIPLKDALHLCANYFEQAVGLFYRSHECRFGKLQKVNETVTVHNSEGEMLLDAVFEARVFNETAELRWLNQSKGHGTAVLLSEQEPVKCLTEELNPLTNLEPLEQTYLLWGEGIQNKPTKLTAGWSRLATARIGKLDVPLPGISHKNHAQLITREYLGSVDCYGNMAVVEERLIKLQHLMISQRVKQDG